MERDDGPAASAPRWAVRNDGASVHTWSLFDLVQSRRHTGVSPNITVSELEAGGRSARRGLDTAAQRLPPRPVLAVPGDGGGQSVVERDERPPAEGAGPAVVGGVAAVVGAAARVGHVQDE